MNIPNKIQIAGITYKIVFHEDPLMSIHDDSEMVARVNFKDSIIDIHLSLGDEMTNSSFLHEIQHAIFFAMGYVGDVNVTLTEEFVERSAQLWNQVIQQIIEFNQKG